MSKADATCPTLTKYENFYDGSAHSITVSGGSGGTINYKKGSSGTWGITNPTRTNGGYNNIYVKVVGDDNHNDVDCSHARINIKMRSLSFDANGGTLSGTSPVYTYNTSSKVYNGEISNTEASIPTVTRSKYTFNGWYTAASGGSQVLKSDNTFTGTAVANYTGTNKWAITADQTLYAQYTAFPQATCPTTSAYTGNYDGTAHTITVSGGSGGTIQYRTSTSESWSTTLPTRTDVGETTVYVRMQGDSNHRNRTCTTRKITINEAPACVKIKNLSSSTLVVRSSTGAEINYVESGKFVFRDNHKNDGMKGKDVCMEGDVYVETTTSGKTTTYQYWVPIKYGNEIAHITNGSGKKHDSSLTIPDCPNKSEYGNWCKCTSTSC